MQEIQETMVWPLCQEDSLEEGIATHSSILAWKISWVEERGGLQSIGSQGVGHDWSDWAPTQCAKYHLGSCIFKILLIPTTILEVMGISPKTEKELRQTV